MIKENNSWRKLKMENLGEIISGGTPKTDALNFWNGNINWITPTDVTALKGKKYINTTKRKISEEGLKNSSANMLPIGSLIVCTRATIGDSVINKVPISTNQGFKSLITKSSVSSEYMYYWMTSNKAELIKQSSGSTFLELSTKSFKSLEVLLPPLPEQQKIAEILSTADDKIEVIDQQMTETQELKKGLMQRLLTKGIGHTEFKDSPLGMIPKSWEVMNVDDFILDKKGAMKIGPFGSALKKDSMVGYGIKVYGQENIFVSDMSFGDRYITQEHYESLKSCELFPGDFIISMMGTIGKCMVVPTGIEKGVMDSHLLRLQLNLERINADYLKHLFRSTIVLNQVNNLAVGGIMAGLSSKIVKDIKFILPTINEQKQFSEIFNSFDDKLEVLSEKKTHYQELKQGLMQQLLTGKIRVKV